MQEITCPDCGEADRLSGERTDAGSIRVVCGACGTKWDRDVRLLCRLCGSENLEYSPRPLWERGRGEQKTPAGRYDAYACLDCGGIDVTSARARPADSE